MTLTPRNDKAPSYQHTLCCLARAPDVMSGADSSCVDMIPGLEQARILTFCSKGQRYIFFENHADTNTHDRCGRSNGTRFTLALTTRHWHLSTVRLVESLQHFWLGIHRCLLHHVDELEMNYDSVIFLCCRPLNWV